VPDSQDDIFLSAKQLKERGIPFSRQWRWKMIKQGRFPKPVMLGAHTPAWRKFDIDAWLRDRAAGPAT